MSNMTIDVSFLAGTMFKHAVYIDARQPYEIAGLWEDVGKEHDHSCRCHTRQGELP